MKLRSIGGAIVGAIVVVQMVQVAPVAAQLIPEAWVTVGAKDGGISYGAGARIFDIGAEVGSNKGKGGVDILKFFSLPTLSPYVGLGIYGGDVSYSGGIQFSPPGNTFFGVGYHSIRGINGQLGVKF